jgi:3',5'-cyclic AMP phosphodiesterase CpdA
MKTVLHIVLTAVITISCSTAKQAKIEAPFSFALIGNTYPESPFKPPHPNTMKLIDALNRENPVFVAHIGNLIYAGFNIGLREIDVRRQLSEVRSSLAGLVRERYFVTGELDTLAGSSAAFESFTGYQSYHSFSYGSVLFIALNSTDNEPGKIGDEQWKWLEKTLAESLHESIVIFIHHPPFLSKPSDVKRVAEAERLHALISRYPVRAVISGAGEYFSLTESGRIQYINAGCVPLFKKEGTDQYRYYIITFNDGHLSIAGKKL